MKTKWQIKDIIDLEYFLHMAEKEEEDGKDTAKRERDIYLNKIKPLYDKASLSNREIIKIWLDSMRKKEKEESGPDLILPGDAYKEIYRIFTLVFIFLGISSGSGLAFSLISYSGDAPVNVSVYFASIVLVQIFLLVFIIFALLLKSINRMPFKNSLIYSFVARIMAKAAAAMIKKGTKKLSGAKRAGIEAAIGVLKGQKKIYGSVFFWPGLILIQVFGVSFNLGAISATLLKVLGTDIAFGWQSTVQFGSLAVYKFVEIIAMPWSWLIPKSLAHPSLLQIEGSHIILKNGIYHLATPDLVAWWPFLIFCVIFYGLLPRTALLLGGLIFKAKKLAGLDFTHSACDRLITKMKTPVVASKGNKISDPGQQDMDIEEKKEPENIWKPHTKNSLLLIPDDIFEECDRVVIKNMVLEKSGWKIAKTIKFGADYSADLDLIKKITRSNKECNILILQEAWQPPINENIRFIGDLRKIIGEKRLIKIIFIGTPGPDTILTPPDNNDMKIWNKKLKILGDPYLSTQRLVAYEN